MASITGGNALVVAMATIILMVVVVLFMLVSVFNLDNLLSVSLSDLVNREQVDVSEVSEEQESESVQELDSGEARQLLGFIDYPVVAIPGDQISIFSSQVEISVFRLSDEQIIERCAFVTIPFNHDRCMRAERGCAAVIESSNEHWACLHEYAYYIGKKL